MSDTAAEIVALRDLEHGDWKTCLAHPGRWPTIPKGTSCAVVGLWTNLYGHQLKIIGPNGEEYDVPPGNCAPISNSDHQ